MYVLHKTPEERTGECCSGITIPTLGGLARIFLNSTVTVGPSRIPLSTLRSPYTNCVPPEGIGMNETARAYQTSMWTVGSYLDRHAAANVRVIEAPEGFDVHWLV